MCEGLGIGIDQRKVLQEIPGKFSPEKVEGNYGVIRGLENRLL